MAALNAMNPTIFGQTVAKESMGAALGGSLPQTKTATDLGFMVGGGGLSGQAAPTITSLAKTGGVGLMGATPQALGAKTIPEVASLTGAGGMEAGGALKQAFTADAAKLATPALTPTPASPGLLAQASDLVGNLSTAEKIGLGVAGAS